MADKKPVVMTVDDDSGVLRAIARDLRRQYGDRYRIVRAESGDQALESLKKLRLTDEPVALLLADQRMPGLTGDGEFNAQWPPSAHKERWSIQAAQLAERPSVVNL